jgi:hypothetical protein
MSKLARALAVAAMLAATSLAGLAAAAQAQPTDQLSGQADATVRPLLANERSSIPNGAPAQTAAAAHRRLLAQERYYSTWTYDNTSAPAPVQPQPSRPAGWRTPALAALAAVLALAAAVAVLAARRAHRGQRAEQTA